MARTVQVSFDAADPELLLRFWCAVLGYEPEPLTEQARTGLLAMGLDPDASGRLFAAAVDPAGTGPRLLAHHVPEGKPAKNRLHLDVHLGAGTGPEQVAAEVERLVALGARHLRTQSEHGSHWAVLTDPEGNEFCVA